MKRMLLGLAVAALAACTAQADPGGFAPPAPGGGYGYPAAGGPPGAPPGAPPATLVGTVMAPPDHAPDRYGMLPGLRKLFTLDKGCSTCKDCGGIHKGGRGGCGPHGCGPGGPGGPGGFGHGYNPYAAQQGTLVFPHHPYVRSPRDFFMYEPGR
jgi:hypothetical protein